MKNIFIMDMEQKLIKLIMKTMILKLMRLMMLNLTIIL